LQDERRGTAGYHVDPLLLFGHYYFIGGKKYFAENPTGYDLKYPTESGKSIFTQFSSLKTTGQTAIFAIVDTVQRLHGDFYIDRVNVSLSNLSLLSLVHRSGEIYLLVDYTNPSPRAPPDYDHIGVLLQVTQDATGSSMSKVIYQLNILLAMYLDKFRQGSSIGEFLSIQNQLRVL
jgi:hypothetical protein